MDAAAPDHTHDAPQLRTLLLTDLCDSTALVERLGDTAAAALFRDHDRLVLELQQRWRGRLIDRSDGLLLLFERPIDGLGFALDYRRGLEDLGKAHDAGQLRARAGLHVGEVLIWRNSDEAVDVGAKQVEVEGLAKPFAARLMQLALPGQILLSAVAEPLVRRAVRELGERADALKWRSYGRWRFKGVPTPFEIHEVGEAGLAPLRTPRSDAKAWRDVPLWRRPIALVAEVAAVAVLGAGIWLATRAEPALAFNERDWVVVGDLRNLTGQTMLDDSLEQAFRISLEQSRYVNVLSPLRMQQILEQMRLDPTTAVLDRDVAVDVALRGGARAVVLPTVSEVDGEVRFAVEVVDPQTQSTVFAEQAQGKSGESILELVDSVSVRLRGRFGEALSSIQQASVPLPVATTSKIDALRSYALAEKAFVDFRFAESRGLFEAAIKIDPAFARAHLGLAMFAWASADHLGARRHVEEASAVRHLLTSKDQLFVSAWEAEVSPTGNSLPQWLALSELYPDDFSAQSNASWQLLLQNRYEDSLVRALLASTPQAPRRTYSLVYAARAHNALGKHGEAMHALDLSALAGKAPAAGARSETMLLLGRSEEAAKLLADVKADGDPTMWLLAQRGLASMALESGDYSRAMRIADQLVERAEPMQGATPAHYRLVRAMIRSAAGKPVSVSEVEELESELRARIDGVEPPKLHEEYLRYAALLYLAQRDGHGTLVGAWLEWLLPKAQAMENPTLRKFLVVVRANQLGLDGRLAEAQELLAPQLDGAEFFLSRLVMRNVCRSMRDQDCAVKQQEWLASHRGRAWVEVPVAQMLQPLNVAESKAARAEVATYRQ